MKITPLLFIAIAAMVSAAGLDENLIINPQFRESKRQLLHLGKNIEADYPADWSNDDKCAPDKQIVYLPDGGPDGLPAMALRGGKHPVTVSQYGFKLVPGGKYRFQAKLKLTNFKAEVAYIALYDFCWCKDEKLFWGPASNTDWFTVSKVFTAIPSPNELYGIGIHASNFTGEVRLADVSLTAADEASAAGASPNLSGTPKRLTPVTMNLHSLPCDNASICLGYPVRLPDEGDKRYEAVLKMDGKEFRAPFSNGFATVHLPKSESGMKTFRAVLVDKKTQTELASSLEHTCRFVEATEIKAAATGKRLNMQVVELLNDAFPAEGVSFTTAQDGWVHIALTTKDAQPELTLDGKPCSLAQVGDCLETQRHLSAGTHRISCPKLPAGTQITVRRIPEILCYPIFRPFHTQEEPPCDEAYSRRYIFPSCNTFNKWGLPGGEAKTRQLQSEGIRILGSVGFRVSMKPTSAQELLPKLFINAKVDDGFTLDEIAFIDAPSTLRSILDACWLRGSTTVSPLYYLWIGFTDYIGISPGLHQEICAAFANVNNGSGKIILENYPCTQDTEEMALESMKHTFCDGVSTLEALVPGIRSRLICCMSNYSMPHTYNNDRVSGVDFKVLLDRACQMIATSEPMNDLGGIGFYNTSAGDEETVRWFFALTRHYFIEGKTDSMAERHGFKYRPNLIQNEDFAEEGRHWEVRPSEKDGIAFIRQNGYGAKVQHRPKETGDAICVMTRSQKAPNEISQTISGLVPGRLYSVRAFVADLDDVQKGTARPERFAFRMEVKGGDVQENRSYIHVDERPVKDGGIRTNTHKVVFRAISPEAQLRFSDWLSDDAPGGPVGQRLSFNFVQVKPYFESAK